MIWLLGIFVFTHFDFVKKYKLTLFLNTINKNPISKIMTKFNRICKSTFKKDNSFGLIKAKNVSIHKAIQIIESEIINLKPYNLLNIKKYQQFI